MSNESPPLLVCAEWILPIVPRGAIHEGWALAVSGGRIDGLGPRDEMRARYPGHRSVDLPGHVLLPGLVNAHGHMAMTLLRGLAEDLPLEPWLKERIWPIEGRLMSESFVADGVALALLEMLASGTTTASDMYFFPERTAALAREAGIRAQICFPVIGHPNAWSTGAADALHRGLALHDEYRGDPRVRIAFGPHSTYALDRSELDRVFTLADEIEAPVQIHLHEGANEVDAARALTGRTPIEMLAASGYLMPRLQAVHVTAIDEADLGRLAAGGAGVVHCPHSNLKLGSGFCPVTRLLEQGVRVGLGTDGAASNNSLDLFAELRTASLVAKALSGDAGALPTTTVLETATIGGAAVLGLDHEIGSLEPGKAADFVAVALDHPGALPVHRPDVALVHGRAGAWVRHVWIDGRHVVDDGNVLTLDGADIRARAARWGRIIGHESLEGERRAG